MHIEDFPIEARISILIGLLALLMLLMVPDVQKQNVAHADDSGQVTNLHIQLRTLRRHFENGAHVQLSDREVANSRIIHSSNCAGWVYFYPENVYGGMACRLTKRWSVVTDCHFPDTETCPDEYR